MTRHKVTAQELRLERIARDALHGMGVHDAEAIERLAEALTEGPWVEAEQPRIPASVAADRRVSGHRRRQSG